MPKPKPWKPSPELKKAARVAKKKQPKRPRLMALIVPPIEEATPSIEEVLSQAIAPVELSPEETPELHIALYADNAPLEPEAVVIVAAGKKSLFKRLTDWARL